MPGSQRIKPLMTANLQESYLTLGGTQLPPLPNGANRTSFLGLLWNGETTRQTHSIAMATLSAFCVTGNLCAFSHSPLEPTL